jgi:hypothetical protein
MSATAVSKGVVLTEEEVQEGVRELYDTTYTTKFPRVDRMHADPIYNNQVYCLHSFVPSKNAVPDEHGVFGFVKFRGTFHNQIEADQRAEFIIRNVDSYHPIQTAWVGRPYPICADTKNFVKDINEVDIKKKATEVISADIKQKRMDEKKEIEDIKEREERLLSETKEDFVREPLEVYTELQCKKANLVWTYVKTQKALLEMQPKIRNAYREIREMDAEDSSYYEEYFEKFTKARTIAGITTSTDDNFVKYMVEDADLDFDVSL